MEATDVKCPQCGSTQLTADQKGLRLDPALQAVAPGADVEVLVRKPHGRKATVTCRHCGFKFKAGARLRGIEPLHGKEAPPEKKVASFMARFFGVALAAIMLLLGYLWAIGKFG